MSGPAARQRSLEASASLVPTTRGIHPRNLGQEPNDAQPNARNSQKSPSEAELGNLVIGQNLDSRHRRSLGP